MTKIGYKIELIGVTGSPTYRVTTPDHKVFHCETKWGVRRVIRMNKAAKRMTEQEEIDE